MPYVNFITDAHLLNCISILYSKYENALTTFNEPKFFSNKVDPFKMIFDMLFLGSSPQTKIQEEVIRQLDKTTGNFISEFHINILSGINGFQKEILNKRHGFYICDTNHSYIIAEIRNKHNTITKRHYNSVVSTIEACNYYSNSPNLITYLVVVMAKNHSFYNQLNCNGHTVYEISIDRFYQILTNNANAFRDLSYVLPSAIHDFLQSRIITPLPCYTSLGNTLSINTCTSSTDLYHSLLLSAFNTYYKRA